MARGWDGLALGLCNLGIAKNTVAGDTVENAVARRPLDVVTAVLALGLLAVLGWWAQPTLAFEQWKNCTWATSGAPTEAVTASVRKARSKVSA